MILIQFHKPAATPLLTKPKKNMPLDRTNKNICAELNLFFLKALYRTFFFLVNNSYLLSMVIYHGIFFVIFVTVLTDSVEGHVAREDLQ